MNRVFSRRSVGASCSMFACLAVLAGWLAAVAFARAANAAQRPNVIIIFADDLGYGDLSCYGRPDYQTPHLDRMAAEGVRMTDFYVSYPICAPSRSSILTGRYPFRTTVVGNPAPDVGAHDLGLPPDEITIAEALKSVGYATACIGKWHLGHRPQFYPRNQGFDEYFGILYSNDMRPVTLVEDEQVVEYPVVQAYLTRRYTQRAVDFITRHRDQPFFLYLPHAMPHKPLAASDEFYSPHTPDNLYADVVRELDWSVGQILASLQELGLDEQTLVVFTSDNGPWYGGHTAGLRGMKGSAYEGGIRVPGIARWPGKLPAGAVRRQPCGTIDLFPTCLQLAGVPLPTNRVIDGRDIMPVWVDDAPSPHAALFGCRGGEVATVRSGTWKLHLLKPNDRMGPVTQTQFNMRSPDGVTIIAPLEQYSPRQHPGLETGDASKTMMLFNLQDDPAEQHDVADRHPQVVARLKAYYDEVAKDFPNKPPSTARTEIQFLTLPGRITPDQPVPIADTLPAAAR